MAKTVAQLLSILSGGDEWAAANAAQELGQRRVTEAVPELIKALHSVEWWQAWAKVDKDVQRAILGAGEGEYAIAALQRAAALALAEIGDARAIPHLLELYHSSAEAMLFIGRDVASALFTFATPEVIALREKRFTGALRAIKSHNIAARVKGVWGLSMFRTEEAIEALIGATSDSSESVRFEAAEALRGIGNLIDNKVLQERIKNVLDSRSGDQ